MTYLVVHTDLAIQQRTVQQLIRQHCKDPKINLDQLINHPDIHILENSVSGKLSIGINEVKALQKKLSFYPIQLPSQFVIIWQAEILTIQAQNTLLKDLEEHHKSIVYILITRQKATLLPTVLSRCHVIYPTNNVIMNTPNDNHLIVTPSVSPTNLPIKKEFSLKHKKLIKQFCNSFIQKQDLIDQFVATFQLTSERSTKLITVALQNLVILYRQNITQNIELATANQMTIWQKQLSLVQQAGMYIKQNGNKRLVLENLVLEVGSI